MLLADVDLELRMHGPSRMIEPWQRLVVRPLAPNALQPCSIDVHLGRTLKIYEGSVMDTRRDNSPWWRELHPGDVHDAEAECWVLQPDRFYLGVLQEMIRVPEDCCAHLHGVSTRAREGVMVHQQAGLLDPGWWGHATLEISVRVPHTRLYAGQRIGQVALTQLSRRCRMPYSGRYQGNVDATPAIHRGGGTG
jgi:dCTP deaminase